LPPLRERGEDVLLLAKTFLRRYSRAYEVPIIEFTAEAKDILMKYPWPGNVRELKHAVERAVLLGEQGKIDAVDLHSALGMNRPLPAPAADLPLPTGPRIEIPADGMSLKEGERRLIEEVLSLTKWNRTKASEILGISRPRLKRKIDEYHIGA
jgi:DNA-binding NtrC family response regulator